MCLPQQESTIGAVVQFYLGEPIWKSRFPCTLLEPNEFGNIHISLSPKKSDLKLLHGVRSRPTRCVGSACWRRLYERSKFWPQSRRAVTAKTFGCKAANWQRSNRKKRSVLNKNFLCIYSTDRSIERPDCGLQISLGTVASGDQAAVHPNG